MAGKKTSRKERALELLRRAYPDAARFHEFGFRRMAAVLCEFVRLERKAGREPRRRRAL